MRSSFYYTRTSLIWAVRDRVLPVILKCPYLQISWGKALKLIWQITSLLPQKSDKGVSRSIRSSSPSVLRPAGDHVAQVLWFLCVCVCVCVCVYVYLCVCVSVYLCVSPSRPTRFMDLIAEFRRSVPGGMTAKLLNPFSLWLLQKLGLVNRFAPYFKVQYWPTPFP